jgi:hypothetical protein
MDGGVTADGTAAEQLRSSLRSRETEGPSCAKAIEGTKTKIRKRMIIALVMTKEDVRRNMPSEPSGDGIKLKLCRHFT